MNCLDSLDISAGVTSVTGSGGKTTLLHALSQEIVMQGLGTVILATTTRFLPFEGVPLFASANEAKLEAALCAHGVVCVGVPLACAANAATGQQGSTMYARLAPDDAAGRQVGAPPAGATGQDMATRRGVATISDAAPHEIPGRQNPNADIVANARLPKLGPSPIPMAHLARIADYVLVEADGSRRLPLKAHAANEPVIPRESNNNLLVVGASGMGRPICEAVHRPGIFCDRAGCEPGDVAAPRLVARCIAAEAKLGITCPSSVVINQAEMPQRMSMAAEVARELHSAGLDVPVFAGSIRNHGLARIQI